MRQLCSHQARFFRRDCKKQTKWLPPGIIPLRGFSIKPEDCLLFGSKRQMQFLETKLKKDEEGFVCLDRRRTGLGFLDSHCTGLESDFCLNLARFGSISLHVARWGPNSASFVLCSVCGHFLFAHSPTEQGAVKLQGLLDNPSQVHYSLIGW